MPRVSIIIPLYNRRMLIERCVASVRSQGFRDWELIVVDDGSTDAPQQVLQPICEMDSRIRYIRKENGGASSARNAGIACASGEYLVFVDSDDELLPGALDVLVAEGDATGADLVVAGMRTEGGAGADAVPCRALYAFPQEAAAAVAGMLQHGVLMSAYAKLYRRTTVGSVRFPESQKTAEDLVFNLAYLQRCTRVCLKETITYLIHPGTFNSVSASFHARCMEDLKAQYAAYERFLAYAPSAELEEQICASVRLFLMHNLRMLCLRSGLTRREICAELQRWYSDALYQKLLAEPGASWQARLAASPRLHAYPELYRLIELKQRVSSLLRRAFRR